MTFSAKDMILKRKSVRTFDGKPLSDADRKKLEDYINTLTNPFDVPVDFRLLDAKEHKLSSPVIVGENTYLAAKVRRKGHYEIAYGYSFEKTCLYALSLGIGTVMLAASLSRSTFEQAMNVQADERIAFDELYFDDSFEAGLKKESAGDFAEALEMARLSPSAANKQPWRAVVAGNRVHFYEQKSMKDNVLGDIQKVDVGIALAHFDMTMEENGASGRFVFEDPGITVPADVHYIITYERTK